MLWLRTIVSCVCCVASIGCGGQFFVGFVSNPGGNSSITGRIDAINSGFASNPSGITLITSVTFVNADGATNVYFCGDQQHLFMINQTVHVEYTVGLACSVLIRVVVVDETAISFSARPPKSNAGLRLLTLIVLLTPSPDQNENRAVHASKIL